MWFAVMHLPTMLTAAFNGRCQYAFSIAQPFLSTLPF